MIRGFNNWTSASSHGLLAATSALEGLLCIRRFSAFFKFKMFYCVGDVNFTAIDSGFFESFVQHLPRWTYERMSAQIFFVARLLADQDHTRVRRSFPKNTAWVAFRNKSHPSQV
jgi:hypothetical protein